MVNSSTSTVRQFGLKAHKPSDMRNPPKKSNLKTKRRIEELADRLGSRVAEERQKLKYASIEHFHENFYKWVARVVVDRTEVVDPERRDKWAKDIDKIARRKKKIFLFTHDSGEVTVCDRNHYDHLCNIRGIAESKLRRAKTLHPSGRSRTDTLRIVKREDAA